MVMEMGRKVGVAWLQNENGMKKEMGGAFLTFLIIF